MSYKEVYEENQKNYEESNRLIFKKFLVTFKEETKLSIDNLMRIYKIDSNDPAEEFYFLKWVLFNYGHKYISYFYSLLENMGYDLYSEIIDTMKLIGKDTNDKVSSDILAYTMISPYINGITIPKNKPGLVIIHSDELGDYTFYPSRVYLNNNEKALNLINDFITERYCHQISWEMMKHFDKCQLITSLLPLYFEGTHYHTVIRDNRGLIIDSANDAVYTEEVRDFLFKGKDICTTKKEELEKELNLAMEVEDEESKIIDFPPAMLLALYNQSKILH